MDACGDPAGAPVTRRDFVRAGAALLCSTAAGTSVLRALSPAAPSFDRGEISPVWKPHAGAQQRFFAASTRYRLIGHPLPSGLDEHTEYIIQMLRTTGAPLNPDG